MEKALEHMRDPEPPAGPLDPELEAVFWHLLHYGSSHIEELIDHWLTVGGFSHALRVAVVLGDVAIDHNSQFLKGSFQFTSHLVAAPGTEFEGQDYERYLRGDLPEPWAALRPRLTAASQEAWEDAHATADELFPNALIDARVGLAYLFPESPHWADDLLRSGEVTRPVARLALSQVAGDASAVIAAFPEPPTLEDAPYLSSEHLPKILVNTLSSAGAEACVPFAVWLGSSRLLVRDQRLIAEIFALLDHPAALDALFRRADHRNVITAAKAATRRFPQSSLRQLAGLIDEAPAARQLLLAMAEKKSFPKWLAELDEGSQADVRALIKADREPAVETAESIDGDEPAPVEELPEMLRTVDKRTTKILKRRTFWQPHTFTRPRLVDGRPWPLSAVDALGVLLIYRVSVEIRAAREVSDASSLAEFAWDLFQAWLASGGPSAEKWAFFALAELGDDTIVRRLDPLLRQWPDERQHPRAKLGLEVLRRFGSDVALLKLDGFTRGTKHKGLRKKAQEIMGEVAEQRGLSQEDLADRLVPDFGLDENGSRLLDFGPRQFRVSFNEQLKPVVTDLDGAPLRGLPRSRKTDDPVLAKRAGELWKGLQKDVGKIANREISRLERAMYRRRRFSPEVFREFFLGHPLIGHLVRRLIWATYDDEGRLLDVFRVAEDGTFADAEDETWHLGDSGIQIGLPHPIELDRDLREQLGETLSDYEILQPFSQIGRELFFPTDEQAAARFMDRWQGLSIAPRRIYALLARGWRRGEPQEYGMATWIERPCLGRPGVVVLPLEPGLEPGRGYDEDQILGKLVFLRKATIQHKPDLPFGELDPITFSEVMRGLSRFES